LFPQRGVFGEQALRGERRLNGGGAFVRKSLKKTPLSRGF
jgi:hypothetical protein